jgi:uncharacterized membrane protein (DUF485 family)
MGTHQGQIDPISARALEEKKRDAMNEKKERDDAAELKLGGKTTAEIIDSPDFKALVRRRWTVSIALTVALFLLYYGFILLIAVDKPLMATKVGEFTTLAIPLGIGVIVGAWALTAAYVVWANAKYDPMVEKLKGRLLK